MTIRPSSRSSRPAVWKPALGVRSPFRNDLLRLLEPQAQQLGDNAVRSDWEEAQWRGAGTGGELPAAVPQGLQNLLEGEGSDFLTSPAPHWPIPTLHGQRADIFQWKSRVSMRHFKNTPWSSRR